ncbi:MAG TPA: NnrS family protein, partial [Burkholderiaceae bacterium]|nr:NnrS family protein [Burkholderiaceae bacterium]
LAMDLWSRIWDTAVSLQLGLDVILFLLVVMAGRVIPIFTNNGVPGTHARRHPTLESLSLGSVLVLIAADALQTPSGVIAALTFAAALVHAGRLFLWQTWRTFRTPLVWILHASYAWIVVHLMLRMLVAIGAIAAPLAIHALTIGAIGGMTLGMMTRTSKGHTARSLIADRYDLAGYCLVQLAALVRVFGAMLFPAHYRETVVASGALWCAAFGLFVIRYWVVVSEPRLDGKPG